MPQNEYYSPRGNLGGVNIPGGGLVSTVSSHVASFNYTHIFGSTLTNEFYAAGAYFSQNFLPKDFAATAGNPYTGVFNNGSHVQPTLEDYGNDGLPLLRTPDASYGGIFAKKQVRIAGDNLTKVIGKHTIRAGVFYQWDANPQVAPFINTNGTISQYYIPETFIDPVKGLVHSTGPVNSGSGGNFLADFAEGQIQSYNQTNIAPEPNLYFWNLAGFVQDHWRLSSRVTVDAGVRLEHFTPWQDSHNAGLGVFTPEAYAAGVNSNVLPGIQWHGINSSIPNGGRPTRGVFASPRGGVAWDVHGTGNTVVRGGIGVYRAHDSYNDADNQQQTTQGLRTATVAGPILLSSISSQAVTNNVFVPDSTVYAFDPKDDEEPRVFTYNLAIDQRLPGKMLLEVAYVGNRSDKLLNDGSTQNTTLDNLNTLPIGSLFQPYNASKRPDVTMATGIEDGHVFPIFTPPSGGNNTAVSNLTQGVIDSYKKYPLYNHLFVPEHNTYSNYNGLQVGLTRQQGHGTFSANYTFSKALGILGIGGSSTYSYPGDPFNYRNDYNSLPFDRRNIFNAAYSYVFGDLVKNKLIGGVTNGWEVSGITNYQTGPNLQATISSDFGVNGNIVVPVGSVAVAGSNVSTCTSNPPAAGAPAPTCQVGVSSTNILGTPDVNLQPTLIGNYTPNTSAHQYINPNAFALPALGTNGQYRYPALYGPSFLDTDVTAAKQFKIRENSSIQLRIAAFNFINRANNTFTNVNLSNYTVAFNETSQADLNSTLLASRVSNGAPGRDQFGTANLKTGRRILELGLRYDF